MVQGHWVRRLQVTRSVASWVLGDLGLWRPQWSSWAWLRLGRCLSQAGLGGGGLCGWGGSCGELRETQVVQPGALQPRSRGVTTPGQRPVV